MSQTPLNQLPQRHRQPWSRWELFLFLTPLLILVFIYGGKYWQNHRPAEVKIAPPIVLLGHTGTVCAVAFSPDSKYLASGGEDGTIRIWECATGIQLFLITAHSDVVMSVAFSTDGKTIVSGSPDNTVKVWDIKTRKLRKTLNVGSMVRSVSFSPDNKVVAAGSNDRKVRLWNVKSGKQLRTLIGHRDGLFSVVFSPDGKYLSSGDGSGAIHLWSTKNGRKIHSLQHEPGLCTLTYSADNKFLAATAHQQGVSIWQTNTFEKIMRRTRKTENFYAQALAFAPDNKTLAIGSQTVEFCDASTSACKKPFPQPQSSLSYVQALSFSPDGKWLAGANIQGYVELWRMN
jgi:WD40 repeat protein